MIARRGVCLVLAAPSGAGKSSLSRAMLEAEPGLALSVSATTRPPRPGEQEGVHYFFKSPEEFAAMEAAGGFLETAEYLGRRYGTPRAPVEAALAAGRDVLFDIDCQGHALLRAALPGDVVGVFLLPPSMAELERRLRARGQDSESEIARRLAVGRAEIARAGEFDHVVVNAVFEETVATLRAILAAARTATARLTGLPAALAALG
ncbi:MAG: guanylate kinase [Acetobacteraceae bacterium]|nr:guanylate kinase [Acetobacteraceae bacterium]MCX7685291.1 guanylate kinase [Acetobacteraceae bacterium]MDW8398180.1 guanylate kinase [Acetobacteraceae bacterium]